MTKVKVKIIPAFVRDHPIRFFAVVCVAGIAIYIGWMANKINEILSGPGWCRVALGAEKASPDNAEGTIKGLQACVGLLTIQLKSLATNSHILFGSLALCLVTLIVIVIAKGKADVTLPGGQGGFTLAPSDEDTAAGAAAGAAATAAAASSTAAGIAAGAAPAAPVPAPPKPPPDPPKFTPPPGETL